jgi:hypothetical protein
MTNKFTILAALILATAVAGAGCNGPMFRSDQELTGPTVSSFAGLTPQEATARINLVPGSVIFMRHIFAGFGDALSTKIIAQNQAVTSTIVLDRFAPNEIANLTWKTTAVTGAKNEASQTLTGNLEGLDLKETYNLYLPAYWPEKEHAPSLGSSGIWLSKEVFEGLARNRVASLRLELFDPLTQGRAASSDFKPLLDKLSAEVTKIENRVDIYRLDGEAGVTEWPLRVNGEDIKVEVIKAHLWFGDLVVLNHAQNPMVLKFSLNNLADPALKSLLDYEIFELKDVLE